MTMHTDDDRREAPQVLVPLAPGAPLALRLLPSPLGDLRLWASGRGLARVGFPGLSPGRRSLREQGGQPMDEAPAPGVVADAAAQRILDQAARELDEYFAGRRQRFTVPLAPAGTEFQRQVWQALLTIPYGATDSYGRLARQVGRPSASRAVGAANGRNPIAVIVPCHRVIGANGTLTGYAGGLPIKEWLLGHERRQLPLGLAEAGPAPR